MGEHLVQQAAKFFEKVFVEENVRAISAADLASRLDDDLYALNERPDGPAFPKPAKDTLL